MFRRRLYQRGWLGARRLPAPVVSVGNLAVGGTGKTPVTAYLARFFQEQQQRVAILSRGYGGRRTGVTCVSDGERLYYQPPEVGEEAFQLAQSLPGVLVYTGPDRYKAGMAAWRENRPDIFLLDDGFQHFQLARDLNIVLLDADRPWGNGRLLPAGPLREPLSTLREADALILTRFDENRHQDRLSFLRGLFPHQEIFTAAIKPASARRFPDAAERPLEALRGLAALAFAGLARPEVFQDSLATLGVDLRGYRTFPDHYAYTPDDLLAISQEARERGIQALITTSKDWARLGQVWPGPLPLWVLEVAAQVEQEDDFQRFLAAALGQAGDPSHSLLKPRGQALHEPNNSSNKPIYCGAGALACQIQPAPAALRVFPRGLLLAMNQQKTGGRASVPAMPLDLPRLNLEKVSAGGGLRASGLAPSQPLPPQVRRCFQNLTRGGKPPPNPQNVHRILLRAPNWLGDAVMGLPVLAGLIDRFPAAQVTVLAAPRVAPLYAGQPGRAEVIAYPAGSEKWRTLWGLRGKFDLALALPNSLESALGLWLTRSPHRLGYAANGRTPFLTTVLKDRHRLKGLHQVFYYLGLLEGLGPVTQFSPPSLEMSAAENAAGRDLLVSKGLDPGSPWVGLAPGAAYGPAKRWPPARFAAVGDILHQEFQAGLVLLGGPADQEAAAEVQRAGQGPFLNLTGKTTLGQAIAVLSNLKALITNDSGLMHAAAALGVPVVAIFGSTDPAATRPFTARATIIHHPLPCNPCLERTCSLGYPCLTEVTVTEVAAAARSWLEEV